MLSRYFLNHLYHPTKDFVLSVVNYSPESFSTSPSDTSALSNYVFTNVLCWFASSSAFIKHNSYYIEDYILLQELDNLRNGVQNDELSRSRLRKTLKIKQTMPFVITPLLSTLYIAYVTVSNDPMQPDYAEKIYDALLDVSDKHLFFSLLSAATLYKKTSDNHALERDLFPNIDRQHADQQVNLLKDYLFGRGQWENNPHYISFETLQDFATITETTLGVQLQINR